MELFLVGVFTGIFVLIGNLLILIYVKRSIINIARLYFEPQGENEPSEFFKASDLVCKQMASNIMSLLKTTSMGIASGEARQEKAVNKAIIQDVANAKNPILGLILQKYPKLTQALSDNPNLLSMAINKLSGGDNNPIEEENTDMDLNIH